MEAKDLLRFRTVGDVALTADGWRLAFTLSEIDTESDGYVTGVWTADVADGEPRRVTSPDKKKHSSPRFSPDGKWLAFFRTAITRSRSSTSCLRGPRENSCALVLEHGPAAG